MITAGDFKKGITGEIEIMPASEETDKGKILSFTWKMVEVE